MARIFLLLLVGFIISTSSLAQEGEATSYTYILKIKTIDNPGLAKGVITELRDLLGVKIIYFNDETDEFKLKTHLEFTEEEISNKLYLAGYELDAPVKSSTQSESDH